jgi:hypothetical protein
MPKMPKSVQWRTEPDFSTPPVVPWSAGFAAGDSSPGAAVDWRKLPERTPIKLRRSQSQSVAVIKSSNDGIIRPRSISPAQKFAKKTLVKLFMMRQFHRLFRRCSD